MKRHLILNPNSGRGRVSQLDDLEKFFAPHSSRLTTSVCLHPNDAIYSTRVALQNGADQIIAVGGDGTLNAVASGFFENKKIINPEASLALSCAGTGSDYIRSAYERAPQFMSKWQDVALNPHFQEVDLGLVEAYGQSYYFLNMASGGLGAVIVQMKARNLRIVPRRLAYAVATLRAVTQKKKWDVEILADGNVINIPSLMSLLISKGRYMGGGMKSDCRVSLDDGYFDLTLVQHMSAWEGFENFPKLYTGELGQIEQVKKYKVKNLEIHSQPAFPMECDGDWIGNCNAKVSLLPRCLKICVPQVA